MSNIIGYFLIALLFGLNVFVGYKFVKRCGFNIFPVFFTILALLSHLVFILPFDKKFKDLKIFSVYFRQVHLKELIFSFFLIVVAINALYAIVTKNLHAHKMLPWMFVINGIYFILGVFLPIISTQRVTLSMGISLMYLIPISILWGLTIKLYAGNDQSCDKELR